MADPRSDEQLLALWCEGDSGAGHELVGRHYASVLRYFELNASWAAEDLAQRTFLACVETAAKVRDRSAFRAYVMGIARRQLAMHLRQLSRRAPHEAFDDPQSQTRASTLVARNQEQFLLLRALVDLPRKPQLLLILFYWEHVPSPELAISFEVTKSTIRTQLARARELLRRQMQILSGQGSSAPDDDARLAELMVSVLSPTAAEVPRLALSRGER